MNQSGLDSSFSLRPSSFPNAPTAPRAVSPTSPRSDPRPPGHAQPRGPLGGRKTSPPDRYSFCRDVYRGGDNSRRAIHVKALFREVFAVVGGVGPGIIGRSNRVVTGSPGTPHGILSLQPVVASAGSVHDLDARGRLPPRRRDVLVLRHHLRSAAGAAGVLLRR